MAGRNNVEFSIFDEQLQRVRFITKTGSDEELAAYLGVMRAAVSDAIRRSKIPAGWLLTLMVSENINPEWILTGQGQWFLEERNNSCQNADNATEEDSTLKILRSLPSRLLADELLRRITSAEAGAFIMPESQNYDL